MGGLECTCSRGSSLSGGRVRCEKGQQGWTLSSTVPRENPSRPLGPQFGPRRGDPHPHGLGGWSPPVQYEGSLSLQRRSNFRCLRCQRAGWSQRVALHGLECAQSDQRFQRTVVAGSAREFPFSVAVCIGTSPLEPRTGTFGF